MAELSTLGAGLHSLKETGERECCNGEFRWGVGFEEVGRGVLGGKS